MPTPLIPSEPPVPPVPSVPSVTMVAPTTASPRRLGMLALATTAAVGAVLFALHTLSGVIVGGDGSLIAPFGALATGTAVLTGAGLYGLIRMFSSVRRSSTCGRGGC